MKLSEFIKQLQELDQDKEVIMSIDPEGNGFHAVPEEFLGEGFCTTEYCREFLSSTDTEAVEEYKCESSDKWIPCYCIFP
ncbi:hypothetical protein LCGC14_0145250 [marine sediment metagenome]|uniref:Uncharacterized protein n=1 Tax=marine sediment metagenome TaxID=412755 RepID=A0A0F9XH87_9ZZZZ